MVVTDELGIDFGPSTIGRTSKRAITITNCSPASTLEVSSIDITQDGGGKFNIPAEMLPFPLPDYARQLRPRESANFSLTYEPNEEIDDVGEIRIKSDAPVKTELKIPITGKGSNSACPIASAQARVLGTTQYQTDIVAQPLNNIEFDATLSSGDSLLTYEWTLLTRPSGSQTRLTPTTTTANPKLWLDLAGHYEIELTVYNADGRVACEPSIVSINAVPAAEIHIQLTWIAPAVPNPSEDHGTDLDLHYRHQNGTTWNDAVYTVFWNNRTSSDSWGNTPALANKVTMDIDDQWGTTTENINHIQPLNGRYEIGVHYFSDRGNGGADVTLRTYVRGVLAHEQLDKRMQHKQFWRFGALQWPSGDMIRIDMIACDHTLGGFTQTGCIH